ncbi:MAG: ABC transporter permease, partial [Acidimicrobiia bacterium]
MIDYAIQNILHRRTRSLLTVLGVAMMITLVIVMTAIVESQDRTMDAHAAAAADKLNVQPLMAGDAYPAEGVDLGEAEADRVLRAVSASSAGPGSGKTLYFELEPPPFPNQPPEVLLAGVEPGHEEAFTASATSQVRAATGSASFDYNVSGSVILGARAAATLDAVVGGTVTVLDEPFVVAGVLTASDDLVVDRAVMMPLAAAQDLLGKPGYVSSVILTPADEEATRRVLESDFPDLHVVDSAATRQTVEDGIRVFANLVNSVALVVVVCASLLLMTVMLITVKERTREIGVLRAIGASTGGVVRSVLWEIFFLSALGSLIGGAVAGLVMRFGLTENIFDLRHILTCLPVAVVLTVLSGVLPALRI